MGRAIAALALRQTQLSAFGAMAFPRVLPVLLQLGRRLGRHVVQREDRVDARVPRLREPVRRWTADVLGELSEPIECHARLRREDEQLMPVQHVANGGPALLAELLAQADPVHTRPKRPQRLDPRSAEIRRRSLGCGFPTASSPSGCRPSS